MRRQNLFFFVFFISFGMSALSSKLLARGPSELLISALIQVESGGDDYAIGDRRLSRKAYGCLQIRQPCVDDVNKVYGTNFRAEDCLGNRDLSILICRRYMAIYATKKELGHEPTASDMARIWNGGPEGWKKGSTLKYWAKVKKEMERQRGS